MQRLIAILLMIPLVAFSVSAVHLQDNCGTGNEDHCATGHHANAEMAMAPACNMTEGAHACCKHPAEQVHQAHKQNGKPVHQNPASSCVNCPLCCVVTFCPVFQFDFALSSSPVLRAITPADKLADNLRHHWKPPDRSLSFS